MRRVILVFSLLLVCLFPESLFAQGEKPSTRALSLKVLQERLNKCMPSGNCSDNLVKLCGLTKIEGYVLDEASKDLILFGQVDPESPPLYAEDFAIVLRNVWLKYAELKGNTYYYSDPGCSIDPDPNVMQRLEQIGNKIFSHPSSGTVEEEIEQWHKICAEPQNVRVLGIPFDTRFAKIMVDADYDMKRLVDGSVSLEIDGFTSLVDMTLNKAKEDILNDRAISIPASSMNRFWFYPGENKYKYDSGIVFIDKSPVILLTEAEYFTKGTRISGTGRSDPLAKRLAEDFSAHYSEIARQKPIYLELESLFRFVALAKIIKYEGVGERFNLDYLLDYVPIPQVGVDSMLPGISQAKEFQHHWNYPDGYKTLRLWIPSCGGVSIGIRINSGNFVKDKTEQLLTLRETVLKTRESPDALCWVIPAK